jgi:hypothetical protein
MNNLSHLDIKDTLIITNLVCDEYDITQLNTNFIVYCMLLIKIQKTSFELMFEKDELCDQFLYYDKKEFKNNENNLLKLGDLLKVLNPYLNVLQNEIKVNRKISFEELIKIHKVCLEDYIKKNDDLMKL